MDKNVKISDTIPVVLVTPDMAKQWLDTRFDNERSVRESRVASFARDMESGNWRWIGDTIRFSAETGQLIDGQHRLLAIVRSSHAQHFGIVNLPIEARAAIDTGSARTLGDLLGIGNHIYGKELAAIVRRVLKYRDGTQGTRSGRYNPTHAEGMAFVEANQEDLRRAVKVAKELHLARFPVSPSTMGAVYYLCAQIHQEQAEDFFARIATGEGVKVGDPAGAFRNRCIRTQVSTGRPIDVDDAFRLAIMAWNLWRRGARITKLQTPKGGWTDKNVPVPE